MVREADADQFHSSGGGVTLSSIDLLQERFRQLQRMKELRQEKELLRMLSESERYSPPPPPIIHNNNNNYVSSSSQTMMMLMFLPSTTPKPHDCQLSLSLWPDHDDDSHVMIKQRQHSRSDISRTWFNDAIMLENNDSPPTHHIDTSLRL